MNGIKCISDCVKMKKKKAESIFDNCGSLEYLRKQVIDWLIKNQFVS